MKINIIQSEIGFYRSATRQISKEGYFLPGCSVAQY